MDVDISELVLDALHNRRLERSDSCLVNNLAGQQLRTCDAEALPAIEQLIREVVEPAMIEHTEKHGAFDPDAIFREGAPFGGLDHLLGAYWIICARTNANRAIQFLSESANSVIAEAVFQLPIFFNRERSLSDVELPSEYAGFLMNLRESGSDDLESVASYAIEKLALSEPSQN